MILSWYQLATVVKFELFNLVSVLVCLWLCWHKHKFLELVDDSRNAVYVHFTSRRKGNIN